MTKKMLDENVAGLLAKALADNGYDFPAPLQQQFLQYLQLIAHWNRVFNLTAIRELEAMVWLHLLDSLVVGDYLHGQRIIDVGTGAGLPGIPLALAHPDKTFALLDSNSKKTRFLTQVKCDLKIPNIEVIDARCEKFNPTLGFDSIVSRAFASIPVMLSMTAHLLAPNGQFLALKGAYPEAEILALPPEFSLVGVHKLTIKGLAAERHLVCIQRK